MLESASGIFIGGFYILVFEITFEEEQMLLPEAWSLAKTGVSCFGGEMSIFVEGLSPREEEACSFYSNFKSLFFIEVMWATSTTARSSSSSTSSSSLYLSCLALSSCSICSSLLNLAPTVSWIRLSLVFVIMVWVSADGELDRFLV
jgi:hypothetical protein